MLGWLFTSERFFAVLVEDCFVDVGDDTVAIKSGMDWAGRHFAHPAENILFRNCHFVQNAMAIGSEQSGGVANVRASPTLRISSADFARTLTRKCLRVSQVTFENIVMGPRHTPFTEGPLIHLKSQRGRGGAPSSSVLLLLLLLLLLFLLVIILRLPRSPNRT